MLDLLLLVLPWTADPTALPRPDTPTISIATCVRPALLSIEPDAVCALTTTRVEDPQVIADSLSIWENATRNIPEISRSEREKFRQQIRDKFNEHTLVAAEQLVGHVDARRLKETYDWRAIDRTSDRICLEATPRDETEQLFYGSLRVLLSVETGRVEQIIVVNRNQPHRIVWKADRRLPDDRIRLVNFESEIPPAPRNLVRLADKRTD